MHRIFRRALIGAAALVLVGSLPALAIPVAAPFGSDSMPKAILFTSSAKPSSTSDSNTLNNILIGNSVSGRESGAILTPIGDGSYACTAAVFPGATYTYYFAYRIREYDFPSGDSRATWLTTSPNDARTNVDANKAKTITIPASATHGYVVYNAFGDRTVLGRQGIDGPLSIANPYLRADTVLTDYTLATISTGSDTAFANYEGENVYNFAATQTGESTITLTWDYSAGLAQGFVPTVDGARRFGNYGPGSRSGSSSQYGYRIWRADSIAARPITGFTGAYFQDITRAVTGTDSNWSDNNEIEWDYTGSSSGGATTFVDTSLPDTSSTFLYVVTTYNAYNYFQNDTTRQNFGGGYDTKTRAGAIRVFFIVEHYNEDVVFPNGESVGRVYLTPYIDGERRPELRFPATALRVNRRSIS